MKEISKCIPAAGVPCPPRTKTIWITILTKAPTDEYTHPLIKGGYGKAVYVVDPIYFPAYL